MGKDPNNETPEINLFTTKQNMDTPLITEQEDVTDAINNGQMEVDSDVNEDPRRERLLDESLDLFLEEL